MIDVYASDKEQVEHLKKIWREYGMAIVVGVILAVILGAGWRYLQHHKEHSLEHASMRYEQLLTNVVNGNTEEVESHANRLMERYPHTPYAEFGALQLARQKIYQGDLSQAGEKLQWVMKHGDSSALREIARVRAARVLLAQSKPEEALKLLDKVDDNAYMAAVLEVKGDILLAQGKALEAKNSYAAALNFFPGLEVIQPLVQMKLDDLAGVGNAGAQG